MPPRPLLIAHCRQLLTLAGPREPRRGRQLRDLGLIRDGRIVAVGPTRRIERHPLARQAEKISAREFVVLPGFVDSHTHLVFPSSRADEYEQRLAGATYEQIARRGGGILSTVKKLRRASPEELRKQARGWLAEFAAHGTTTLEAKSGYGLDLKS